MNRKHLLAAGLFITAHAALADIPSYAALDDAQFGTGADKQAMRFTFADGAELAVDSCAAYLAARQQHGQVRELHDSALVYKPAMINLPLCEARHYLEGHALQLAPDTRLPAPDQLPKQVYWVFNNDRQTILEKSNKHARLSDIEDPMTNIEPGKYTSEGINYLFTNVGSVGDDKLLIEVTNTIDGGSMFYSRLFLFSVAHTPWTIEQSFALISE
ncbi:hypothetical protein [Nissabacter sp. SGAir0207]|uniref:hypothetical protein n=1 Tax=Nissabacter sp. SGAir0207 TaxID=2126321 RepID=UPI0010CD2623|nr:hypothetical protein [Nissabacter sp. SGAir0207]QCR35832.1 hypothetical protein C1N62_06895 [Nissabacter sp. SGAir0207]